MALETARRRVTLSENALHPDAYHRYINLKNSWEFFVNSLIKEWKILNIVSVLLLSAILTILQIDSAASDPIIRYSALLSMVCALVSLLYGCVYIIRFTTMRKTHKAAAWAAEGRSKTHILWNVWVLLALPATWLSWSILLYITCIIAFVWRTGTSGDIVPESALQDVIWPRIVISATLGLGIVYFILIMITFNCYGDVMDRRWKARIDEWVQEGLRVADQIPVENGPDSARAVEIGAEISLSVISTSESDCIPDGEREGREDF
ncbi:hypothetical protein BDQ12DRAFT_608172 [Crucibulum laeve]|uniref:Uncharacterized protein n=1 Tax=Crucibulum laeve TaxID=68775 RepID=A0A5C3LXS9_9AGAR|nr:hypothetical protein BDQ12DRAFT_608172 [Crucibulum laeve]